jgi:hypothetical protein
VGGEHWYGLERTGIISLKSRWQTIPFTVPTLSEDSAGKLHINAVISVEFCDSCGIDPHRRLVKTSLEHGNSREVHLPMSRDSNGNSLCGWKRKLYWRVEKSIRAIAKDMKSTPKMHGMGELSRTKNLNFHEKECTLISKTTSELTQDSPFAIKQRFSAVSTE